MSARSSPCLPPVTVHTVAGEIRAAAAMPSTRIAK